MTQAIDSPTGRLHVENRAHSQRGVEARFAQPPGMGASGGDAATCVPVMRQAGAGHGCEAEPFGGHQRPHDLVDRVEAVAAQARAAAHGLLLQRGEARAEGVVETGAERAR